MHVLEAPNFLFSAIPASGPSAFVLTLAVAEVEEVFVDTDQRLAEFSICGEHGFEKKKKHTNGLLDKA